MLEIAPDLLWAFVRESNEIEGIYRTPSSKEIEISRLFVALPEPKVQNLQDFVAICQPDARLRDMPGLDVQVGDYVAPSGGPQILSALEELLKSLPTADPFTLHCQYEKLHPFMDGNGRSGRILWAWQMLRQGYGFELGFLHMWYYQSLERQ